MGLLSWSASPYFAERILFIQAHESLTDLLLIKSVAPGCRYITEALHSSCVQKTYLNSVKATGFCRRRQILFLVYDLTRVSRDHVRIYRQSELNSDFRKLLTRGELGWLQSIFDSIFFSILFLNVQFLLLCSHQIQTLTLWPDFNQNQATKT